MHRLGKRRYHKPMLVRCSPAVHGGSVAGPQYATEQKGTSCMAMLSNLDLIRRVPLFSLLTNEQAQGIADSVVKRRFRRGEIVVEPRQEVRTPCSSCSPQSPCAHGRLARPRSHPGGAAVGRLRRRDEPDRQRAALGHRACRGADRHAHPRPHRVRALPARKLEPELRHHARPGEPPAQRRPGRSNRWPCSTSTAASPAHCSTCRRWKAR